jgi:hypothetical protein
MIEEEMWNGERVMEKEKKEREVVKEAWRNREISDLFLKRFELLV